jgi:hypothetical protein
MTPIVREWVEKAEADFAQPYLSVPAFSTPSLIR